MSLRLNELKPVLTQWVFESSGRMMTVWANQKHLRPPTYPYAVIEVMTFESEPGSSRAEVVYTDKSGDQITRRRVSYKVLTVNVQILAGEVTNNSLDALDPLSDVLVNIQDEARRKLFCEAGMVPISWEPALNLTGISHHEFISRASSDVMFRVSNTVTEVLESTKNIIVDLSVGGHAGTVTATDPDATP